MARWSEYFNDDPDFQPEVEGSMTRMGAIIKRRDRVVAALFQGGAFSNEDYQTLQALMVQPYPTEATPAQLADASHVTRAAMTSRLDRLVGSGLVTRETDPIDRRRVLIQPTAAGRAAWESYLHEGMAREQEILEALTPNEMIQLNDLLRKVILSFDKKAPDSRSRPARS